METDDSQLGMQPEDTGGEVVVDEKVEAARRARLVSRIAQTIRGDKKFHEKAFDKMREDMQFARRGADKAWIDDAKYTANITGRHVRQKTNALYAKNPQVMARARQRLDYEMWDGSPTSIQAAMGVIQNATAMSSVSAEPLPPEEEAALNEANALLADIQQGYAREQMVKKFGKTMEILFSQYMDTQKPLDFKMALKRTVRRTCTTGVGYCEVNFQRETGPAPVTTARLTDARGRLDHLRRLQEDTVSEDDKGDMQAEISELELAVASLTQEPEIVLHEGLSFDFPSSTKVIPDRLCKSLVGFIGARHITLEYPYTVDEVKEEFGVDLGSKFTPYKSDETDGADADGDGAGDLEHSDDADARKGSGMVCVWKHYDKPSGLVYYLVDGHDDFLRTPAAPDVFVSDFWPVYALTFNDVESEEHLFPPSDVTLIRDQQQELNRSRQGLRDHRYAAQPRWGVRKGALDEANDVPRLMNAKPFDVISLNYSEGKLADLLEAIPVPGVDPNLYETGPFFSDAQLTVGASASRLGGTSKSTATEAAIAEGSATEDDASGIDDLDAYLSVIARAASQILVREMSAEQVAKMVGPGAVWPGLTEGFDISREDLMDELWLEVAAGSTGKPNKAVETNNWKILAPILMQTPGVSPNWLARETIRRMDDRADLNEALMENMPAIVAMNRNAQLMGQDPQADPNAQGAEGGDKTSTPSAPEGTDAAFGSNQM
jgi:hypothetical protein